MGARGNTQASAQQNAQQNAQTHYDVAIIGYGPTGATLAKLLGQAGLSVAVFEREAGIYSLPRAIHFDGEVMRVFQNAGLRAQVEAISRPGLKGMHFVDAQGETLLVRGGSALRGMHGCANNYYFHQPELEAVLREGVQRHANVQVHLRHEVFAMQEQGEAGVEVGAGRVQLRYENTADGTLSSCTASYVIGCDGARSLTRRLIGSAMEDLGLHQPWLVFDVMLKEGRGAHLPDHTQQICDPLRPMTYCNVLGARRRWEIMLLPGDDPASIARPENVWPLVSRWVTPEDAVLERAAVYTFHSVIARLWRGKGAASRLLLAGDAAHQTPPFLGQGMCAGIRDAANLAWKLVLVLRGQADDALLDTYESERAPHVRAFIDLAVRLGAIIQATDLEVARERDRKFKSGLPETFTFPAPPLGPGLHARVEAPEGAAALVGLSFPQPLVPDPGLLNGQQSHEPLPEGKLLDEVAGQRFVVLGEAQVLHGVSDKTRARWRALDAMVFEQPGEQAGAWLKAQGARAIVLRPDRYIMGTAGSAAELDALCARLPVASVFA
jgi:3-(3-hydroxy-phenyl)propionate hydroxylase